VAAATVRNQLVYLGELALRSVFLVVVLFVFVQLWRTTYGVTGATELGGFTLPQMIWYLVMTEALLMAQPRVAAAIDQEVKSGQIGYALGRPYSYLCYHYAAYLGETAVRLPVNLAIGGLVAGVSVGWMAVPVARLPLLLAAVTLGISINFCLAASIGLLAFWVEETGPFALLYSRVTMILGGMLLPLELFPAAVRRVAAALPANLVVYWPARVFVGQLPPGWAPALFVRQLGWLLLGAGWLFWLYRRGVRDVVVQGG
jgi:ABC-2 type transport system permease protein